MADVPEDAVDAAAKQVGGVDVARIAISFWEEDDTANDQPCAHGCRVGGHAVYCDNTEWADAPRKCRRTWYTGGEVRDEDCPGFTPNPNRAG